MLCFVFLTTMSGRQFLSYSAIPLLLLTGMTLVYSLCQEVIVLCTIPASVIMVCISTYFDLYLLAIAESNVVAFIEISGVAVSRKQTYNGEPVLCVHNDSGGGKRFAAYAMNSGTRWLSVTLFV